MLVKFKPLYTDAEVPRRASPGAVGYDVYAHHVLDKHTREKCSDLPAVIPPGGSLLFGIGVVVAVPFPYDCQVRPRSGLASKSDIELSNSPGTIDPDYRGEASILLRNRGSEPFTVEKGMRIAQLVFVRAEIPKLIESDSLPPTPRDTGGFGSTGNHEILLGDKEYLFEQNRMDRYYMGIAKSVAELSDCLRGAVRKNGNGTYLKDTDGKYCGALRRYGCIIVKGKTVVAQGFNSRTAECSEALGCIRERDKVPTGTSNDRGCFHAEQAAIQNYAHTGGPSLEGATAYVNAEPCLMCSKLLLNSGISTVVVPKSTYHTNGLQILIDGGVEVRQINS